MQAQSQPFTVPPPKTFTSICQFLLLHDIGIGSFGTVKLALHRPTHKQYAIKIINLSSPSLTQSQLQLISRQIRVHSRLDHPHIIKLWDTLVDWEKGVLYMVMEYARGGSLWAYHTGVMETGGQGHRHGEGKIGIGRIYMWFYQTLQAVKYLHRGDLMHRDIKPENLLIDQSGNVKLCDFGWATNQIKTPRSTFCGTYQYMAPQMVMEKSYDYRIDIWALGVLLYQLIHGKAPFQGSTLSQMKQKINKGSYQINRQCENLLKDLIVDILQFIPEKRLSIQDIQKHEWVKKCQDVGFKSIGGFDQKIMQNVGIGVGMHKAKTRERSKSKNNQRIANLEINNRIFTQNASQFHNQVGNQNLTRVRKHQHQRSMGNFFFGSYQQQSKNSSGKTNPKAKKQISTHKHKNKINVTQQIQGDDEKSIQIQPLQLPQIPQPHQPPLLPSPQNRYKLQSHLSQPYLLQSHPYPNFQSNLLNSNPSLNFSPLYSYPNPNPLQSPLPHGQVTNTTNPLPFQIEPSNSNKHKKHKRNITQPVHVQRGNYYYEARDEREREGQGHKEAQPKGILYQFGKQKNKGAEMDFDNQKSLDRQFYLDNSNTINSYNSSRYNTNSNPNLINLHSIPSKTSSGHSPEPDIQQQKQQQKQQQQQQQLGFKKQKQKNKSKSKSNSKSKSPMTVKLQTMIGSVKTEADILIQRQKQRERQREIEMEMQIERQREMEKQRLIEQLCNKYVSQQNDSPAQRSKTSKPVNPKKKKSQKLKQINSKKSLHRTQVQDTLAQYLKQSPQIPQVSNQHRLKTETHQPIPQPSNIKKQKICSTYSPQNYHYSKNYTSPQHYNYNYNNIQPQAQHQSKPQPQPQSQTNPNPNPNSHPYPQGHTHNKVIEQKQRNNFGHNRKFSSSQLGKQKIGKEGYKDYYQLHGGEYGRYYKN